MYDLSEHGKGIGKISMAFPWDCSYMPNVPNGHLSTYCNMMMRGFEGHSSTEEVESDAVCRPEPSSNSISRARNCVCARFATSKTDPISTLVTRPE